MKINTKEAPGPISIVAVDVGNTSVNIGRYVEDSIVDVQSAATRQPDDIRSALSAVRDLCENKQRQAIVIASVVPEVTVQLQTHIDEDLELRPFVIGENVALPVEMAVSNIESVGVDRVCTASAAFNRTGHACTVVDIGSAVTVDLIDDEGIFRGGAILPGLSLQAEALARHTARLPRVEPHVPSSPLGLTTEDALHSGICLGLAGAIRNIVEQIATESNQWAQVVVTGGGAPMMASLLDFADSIVEHLCLLGAGQAYMRRVAEASGQ